MSIQSHSIKVNSNSMVDTMTEKPDVQTPTWLRVFITFYIILLTTIGAVLGFIVQLLTIILFLPVVVSSQKLRGQLLGPVFKVPILYAMIYLNPFWKIKILKPKPFNFTNKNTLVMSNHISSADPFLLAYQLLPFEFKNAFKSELLRIPIYGWGMYISGELPISFTKEKGGWATVTGSVKKMMSKAKDIIEAGMGIIIYPEGTRSKNGRLYPFKDGFFRFSIENGCQILPVIIFGQQFAWPLRSKLLDYAEIHVIFGSYISSENKTVEELKKVTREQMCRLLEISPHYNAKIHYPYNENEVITHRGQGF